MLWDFQWVYKTKRQCQNYDALTFKCKTEYKLLVLLFYHHHHHHHYSTGKERAALYLFTEKLCCCCTCLWKTLSCLSWDLCCDIQVIWILSVATSNGLGLNVETFLPTWSRSNISTGFVFLSCPSTPKAEEQVWHAILEFCYESVERLGDPWSISQTWNPGCWQAAPGSVLRSWPVRILVLILWSQWPREAVTFTFWPIHQTSVHNF